jgi:predicted transcriptional regulator
MYMYEAVADRINEIRKDQNMSIRQLSSMSNIPYSTLYAIITKKTKAIKIATLGNIICGLGVSPRDFFVDSTFAKDFEN